MYLCSPILEVPYYLGYGQIFGVWRSWLAHLVWDQRVLCSSHSTPTLRRRQIYLPPSLVYILPLTSKKLDDLTAVQLYSRIESCIYLTLCLLKVRVDSLPL